MAEAAVEFLLHQLSAVISEEWSLLGGIREDAEYIMNALSRLRAALRVADEREEMDPQVKAWVKIVRELAYDTEDVLDEFLFRFGGRHTGGGFFTKMKNKFTSAKNLKAQHRLALALQKIKARISENSQYQPILPTTTVHNQQLHDGRVDALFQKDSDLVGFENSKHSLIKLLLGAVDDDLRVHSVVGMGGLGKTTLVKKAYDDAQVIKHFQHRVWVTVSETFKIEELLKDVIKQLGNPPNGFEAWDSAKLIESVRNILSEQKYIIVFDDVWSFDVWSSIKYAFPGQKFGSRIVITTRNSDIGRDACHETKGDVYELKLLSKEDSWELFCKKTFLSDSCPPHLVKIAEDIVNRCGGLPLAIVVIAGILATKGEDIAEWKSFQNGVNLQLKTNDCRMENLKNLLSLSYYDLPYHLKYCFLYFSIYPEDAKIEKNRLIRQWIAEGFVQENGNQVKEEVAEAYLNQLIHRNLIQIAEKSPVGRIIGLRVHDILREIILSKALEQNFAVILTGQNKEWSDKCRRLIIHGYDEDILKCTSSKSHIRSLQFYENGVLLVLMSIYKLLSFDYYIPLKVLDLSDAFLFDIPKEVFKLFHLKYLSLRNTGVHIVSKSIGRLQNLEILDLKYAYVHKLPVEIGKLHKLQHLAVCSIHDDGFYAPFEIGRLLFLQKLYNIRAKKTNGVKVVSEIGNLAQLRKLGVVDLRQEDGKELCSSIEKLTNLISLKLVADGKDILDIQHSLSTIPHCLRTLKLDGRLESIPQWLSSLVSLTKLELRNSCVLEDPLLLLQDLPMLAHLLLIESYEGEGLCFKAGKFPKLKFLNINSFTALKWIMVEEGAIPLLEELGLVNCKLLEQVPLGIQHLSKLNSIQFTSLNDKLMLTLEPNGENYTKISHIPHIEIINIKL
ncbi:PREDICTED: disease resistance protein RPM1-like isoform X5 [Ipomoea nil]|uniref:disease resistance protein RPM1-like isoform X5 n=1 Tax=Ipomoea nil TaxID=35883 RepID=UPI000900DCEB|nr:PREDICTED: disease resistance protein RPM1-like isoform X5 [Ipomoea nil]